LYKELEPAGEEGVMFTKILVVTDGSEHGTQAVRTAADIAVKYGADLTVGHVVLHGEPPSAFRRMAEVEHLIHEPKVAKPDSKNIPGGLVAFAAAGEDARISHEVMEALAGRVVDHAKQVAHEHGVEKPGEIIAEGDTANQILKMADRIETDLIVIGTRGFGPLKGLLMGSVSQKVSQLAKCACLTIR